MIPNVLTIAGSDSSGGAGVQADLKTFSALQTYGASVIVALTAQNTRGVTAVHPVPAEFVAAQMDAVYDDLSIAATKIGMLASKSLIEAVAQGLDRHGVRNVVVDPVMIATTGARLLAPEAIETLRQLLLPRAMLLTPNMPEAAALLDCSIAAGEDEMTRQAQALLALGPRAVLLKGGHGGGEESVDILVHQGGVRRLASPRIATANTHGTGCTLSSAIAALLAQGATLDDAVSGAKDYVSRAIASASALSVGQGHGPVHHFHALWNA